MKTFVQTLLCVAVVGALPGCSLFESYDPQPDVPGLVQAPSNRSAFTAFNRLLEVIQAGTADSSSVRVLKLDFEALGDSLNLGLRPTRVAVYASPRRLVGLVAAEPRAAAALPQTLLLYERDDDRSVIAYEDGFAYLGPRFGLSDHPDLQPYAEQTQRLVEQAAAADISAPGPGVVDAFEGLVVLPARASVDSTVTFLLQNLNADATVESVTTYNHSTYATRLGLTLPPTVTVLFSLPRLTIPLMDHRATFGTEAILRIAVYEDATGQRFVAYTDPAYTAQRHRIPTSRQATVDDLAARVAAFAEAAAALE